jgi:phosphoribosylanthranilate isomerase
MENRLRIKICGMRHTANCLEAAALCPDFMGFIFYPHSKRFVGDHVEIPALPPEIKKVGVVVNEPVSRIAELVERYQLNAIQLHGDESPQRCEQIKKIVPMVIKAFAVDSSFDFDRTNTYRQVADYFLFDTKGISPGGNGIAFDWSLLKKYSYDTPFFLSGGINPANLLFARLPHPYLFGVDLNSGFETSPGVKNINAVREAIHQLNQPNV